jgi:polysaccharide transporter, PST family
VFKNISLSTLLQAVNVGLPFLTIPWYVDKLGVGGYGKIGTVLAIMQLLQLVVDYGFTLTAARSVSASSEKLIVSSRLFADITTIKILVFMLGAIAMSLAAYVLDIKSDLSSLVFIGLILVLGQAITPTWLFLGWQESIKLLILTIIPKALMMPVVFLTIQEDNDLNLAMVLYVAPYLCTGFLCIYVARKLNFMKLVWPNPFRMKEEMINSLSLFKSSVATSASTTLTPLMISGIAGPHALGIYLISDKIRQGIQSVLMPISIIAYPKISEKISNSQDEAFLIIRKLTTYMLIGVVFAAIFISFFGFEVITIIFGDSATQAVESLRILMFVTVLTFCNSIASTYILIPLGRDKVYGKITTYMAILHLALMWFLTKYYSYVGASIAVAISEALLLFLMTMYLLSNDLKHNKCKSRYSIFYKIYVAPGV